MIKHWVNWRFLLPRAVIALVVLIAINIAIEPVLQGFFTNFGERIIRSKIDIESVDVSLATADLSLSSVQIANPRALDRNLVECGSATFDIVTSSVLQRRLRVREATLTGVRFNTPRSKSGKVDLPPLHVDVDGPDADLHKLSTSALRQFARIIGQDLQDELLSIQLSRELSARWPDELHQLEAKVAAYIEQVQAVSKSLDPSFKQPLNAAVAFPSKVEDVEKLRREYYFLKEELDRIVEQAARDQDAIAIARRHDEAVIRRKLALRELDAQELSEYLLGEDLSEQTRNMLSWIKLARRYWPSDVELPAADREVGEDIVIPGLKPLPCALVDLMRLDGTIMNGNTEVAWRGQIQHLTTDPGLLGKPMVIRAETRGEQPLVIEATLDRTTNIARDRIVLSLPCIQQPARTLGNPEQLAVSLAPGKMLLWAELNLEGEKLTGRMLVQQKELCLAAKMPPHYGPRIAERVQSATTDCSSLQAEVRLSGSLDKPSWELRSNLGPQLATSLTSVLRAELEHRQQELSARLDQYLASERTKLAERLKAEEAKVVEKLAVGSQEMDGLKRAVAGRLKLPTAGLREELPFHNPFSRR